MKSESSPDPVELQRLIDGELSTVEVKTLLDAADRNPSQWRTIACEFIEDQLFQRQFESLAETVDPKPAKQIVNLKSNASSIRSMPFVRQLAVAASVALAGLIGYLVGNDGPMPIGPEKGIASNMLAENDRISEPLVTPVDLKPEYRMELLTPDGEALNEVDLFRYKDLNQLYANRNSQERLSLEDVLPASGFSPEMRQQLSRSGYEINESTNYMSGKLEDGRKFVVPVRSIRFDRGH